MLTDELWSKLKAILRQQRIYDKPFLRDMVEGMLYRMRVGCPWRDLPKEFGCWNTIFQKFNRWAADEKTPLISHAKNINSPITSKRPIRRLVQQCFDQAADKLESNGDQHEADLLRVATEYPRMLNLALESMFVMMQAIVQALSPIAILTWSYVSEQNPLRKKVLSTFLSIQQT
jgi:transposase